MNDTKLAIANRPLIPLRLPQNGGAKNARLALIRTVVYANFYQWTPDNIVDGYLFLYRRNDVSFTKYKVADLLGVSLPTIRQYVDG